MIVAGRDRRGRARGIRRKLPLFPRARAQTRAARSPGDPGAPHHRLLPPHPPILPPPPRHLLLPPLLPPRQGRQVVRALVLVVTVTNLFFIKLPNKSRGTVYLIRKIIRMSWHTGIRGALETGGAQYWKGLRWREKIWEKLGPRWLVQWYIHRQYNGNHTGVLRTIDIKSNRDKIRGVSYIRWGTFFCFL